MSTLHTSNLHTTGFSGGPMNILVPLDATARDVLALRLAALAAREAGARITLALPHDARTLRHLRDFAAGEDLALSDAAESYVARSAARLTEERVLADGAAWSSSDTTGELASFADRNRADLALLVGRGRRERLGWRRGTAGALAAAVEVPVVVVDPEDIDMESDDPALPDEVARALAKLTDFARIA